MKKFSDWMETLDTTEIMPAVMGQTTVVPSGDVTARGIERSQVDVDPVVVGHVKVLQDTHQRLKGMFADLRNRAGAFKTNGTRQAFNREMLAGIDGIGRSHALLAPSGGH